MESKNRVWSVVTVVKDVGMANKSSTNFNTFIADDILMSESYYILEKVFPFHIVLLKVNCYSIG